MIFADYKLGDAVDNSFDTPEAEGSTGAFSNRIHFQANVLLVGLLLIHSMS